jgi:diguanylate cyclase (GGDEF)-like protein/PAS domain S-box-containing protein
VWPHSEQVLRSLENRYGPLPEGVPSVAYIFEPGVDGRCLYISPSVEDVLGYPRRQWLEDRGLWDRVLHPDDEERVVSNEAECARSGEKLVQEYRLRAADGRDVWIRDEMTIVRGPNGDRDPLFYGVFLDVTDRKRMETELERLALYDPLTHLPNRALFADRLNQVLSRRGRSATTAVYFLDVDRFKRTNDSLGHAAGDEVLREVAGRLRSVLRPEDTVARFGGDEFTILCDSVGGVLEAVGLADRLQRPLRRPLRAGNAELRLSASIGVALAEPGEVVEVERLIEDADAAMYRAKERGRARYELFDEVMRARAVDRLETENALHRAIERGEFKVFYQPAVDLETGRAVAVEALVRWDSPKLGIRSPDQFIHLAEETGLIVPLGGAVLREACRQWQRWNARGAGRTPRMSVNLSARQLGQPDLVQTVASVLAETGMDPGSLCLEITESVVVEDTDAALLTLQALKEQGVMVGLDDFGTGYASLALLKHLPVDILKVDRSFVSGLGSDPADAPIVSAVIGLAQELGLTAIAEGVETAAQVAELRAIGCRYAQGFYFARPQEAERLTELITEGRDAYRPLTRSAVSR